MRQEFDTSPNPQELAQALVGSHDQPTTDSTQPAATAEIIPQADYSSLGDSTKPAKYTRLSLDEKRQIRTLYANNANIPAIAKAVNRSVSTVWEYLKQFEDTTQEATLMLKASAKDAVSAWKASMEPAKKAGNHKPMKELLAAVGVIKEQADTQVAVQVNLGQGGESLPTDLSFAIDKTETES